MKDEKRIEEKLDRIEKRLYAIYEELARAPEPRVRAKYDDIEASVLAIDVWLSDAEWVLNHPSDAVSLRERLAAIMQRIGSELLRLKWKQEDPYRFSECRDDS